MCTLNFMANRFFARVFSFLIDQRFTFCDFDLILWAARAEPKDRRDSYPLRARKYGATQISRFAVGFMLLRMVLSAFWKLNAISTDRMFS